MSGEKRAPGLPEVVVDEAGKSAPWVPRVGVGLLAALVLAVVLGVMLGSGSPQPADAVPAAAAAGAPATP